MFAVRYLALVALVVWVGGMILLLLAGAGPGELARLVHRAALVCGGVVLVALFAMKFVGPPPYAFPLRAVVTLAMLAVAGFSGLAAAAGLETILTAVTTAAGLFLLSFYVRE